MKNWRPMAALFLLVSAGGCASVTSGKEQKMTFETEPAGAKCTLNQAGIDVAKFETPNHFSVRRASAPMTLVCDKPGYYQARVLIEHTVSTGAWGNLIVGGIIGIMVDQNSGAAYSYYDPPKIAMVPTSAQQPQTSQQIAYGITLLPPTDSSVALSQVAVPTLDTPSSSEASTPTGPPPMMSASASPPSAEQTFAAAPRSSAITSGTPSTPFGPGTWMCLLDNFGSASNPRFTLQMNVGADNSIVIVSYGNASATILQKDPLTFSAINPRGARPMKFIWKDKNVLSITGPNLNDPGQSFYNEGACTKT